EHGERGDGRGPEIPPSHSTAAFPGCAHRDDRRDCPPRRRCHLAVPTPNHHPRYGRLRQHARHGRGAESNFRGAGCRQGLCRRAALERTYRRSVLRRNGVGRAAARGVRVFTVGIGTTSGENLGFEGWSMRVRLDEETLKAIANMTRGEYFYAGTARDLKKVYESLNARLVLEKKDMEISALFSAA